MSQYDRQDIRYYRGGVPKIRKIYEMVIGIFYYLFIRSETDQKLIFKKSFIYKGE